MLGFPPAVCAQGVSIGYLAIDLDDTLGPGGDYWEYQYRVSDPGAVLGPDVSFSIQFPLAVCREMETAPPDAGAGWDVTVLPPIASLLSDGIYDGQPSSAGASLATIFRVRFIRQGAPGTEPGAQPFVISSYDAGGNFVAVLQSGTTKPGFPPSAMESWRQLHFGSPANSGDGADDFDFDRDGLVNLLEFGFGLNPTLGSSLQLPEGQWVDDEFLISFATPAGVDGIIYGAEWSPNLEAGSWTAIPDTGTAPIHKFVAPVSPDRIFVRLRVALP